MKEERFFYVPNAASEHELPEEEARHATRVLRLEAGDEMMLIDGQGSFFRARVTLSSNHACQYQILEPLPQERTWRGHIHLAIAPTKMAERMEWLVEKAVEVGVDEISLLDCDFSERHKMRVDRLDRIAISAMKQSRKAWKTQINEMISLQDFLSRDLPGQRFIAHCYPEIERVDLFDTIYNKVGDDDLTIMVGPEGDFSVREVEAAISKGFVPVTLGQSRLRTETAGLMAVTMANLSLRKQ